MRTEVNDSARTDAVRSPSRASTFARAAIVSTLAFAALFLAWPRAAVAGEGTAPPYRCAKTFVVGASVQSPIDSVVTPVYLSSAYFLSLVSTGGNNCPPPPHSLQITGTLVCGSETTAVNEGPFVITPGFGDLGSIEIGATFGSFCQATLDFVVTLSDGTQLKRTFTTPGFLQKWADPTLAAGAPAGRAARVVRDALVAGGAPRLDLQRVGPALLLVHPGDAASTSFIVTNNDPTESFTGTFEVTAENVAVMPEVPVGTNDRSFGAYSLADPGGGDTPPIEISGPSLGNCYDVPPFPWEQTEVNLEAPIFLAPGASQEYTCDGRTNPLCPKGTMAQIVVRAGGTFSKGDPAGSGSVAFLAVDHTVAPTFGCTGSGRSTSYLSASNPSGPAIGIAGDASVAGNEPWQINFGAVRSSMSYLANGVPPTSGTFNFSGPTLLSNGLCGRYVSEISFIVPRTPDTATMTLIVPFDVLPASTSPNPIAVKIVSLNLLPGAPTGYAFEYPIIAGRVHVMSLNGIDDAVLDFTHQLGGVGVVDGTFELEAMENLSVGIAMNSNTRYTVTSTWRKSKSAAPLAATEYIGFSVTNDIRGFATSAAPFVAVDEPAAPQSALRLLAVPNPASNWASIRLSGFEEARSNASVTLYDAAGRFVREIAVPGDRDAAWDLTDAAGRRVSAGVYFLRAETGREVIARGRLQIIR